MASQVNHATFLVKCIVICLCLKSVLTLKECKTIDVCSCSTDEGEISLRKLAATGKPRFPDIPSASAGQKKYSWNPCNPYSLSQSDNCKDVAACEQNTDAKTYYGIAKQNTATCALDKNGKCTLNYTGTGSWLKVKTRLTVTLYCDQAEEGKVDPMTSTITLDYGTVLHSKYCCPSSSSSSSSGISLGSILVITFSCILIVYIICGILLNKYARNIEGKEAFPNYSFWLDFPYLIKDGCVFTFHSLGRLCGKGSSHGYASI